MLTNYKSDAVKQVSSMITDVAVMPQVVFKVMEASGDSELNLNELEKTIAIDPGFSMKVLKLANSSAYGLPRPVSSIKEAVTFLGTRGIRELAMAAGVFDFFLGKTDVESMRRREWWRHSLDTAFCARHIARRFPGKINVDEAYTCSLLHLLGKTLMDRVDSSKYAEVMGAVATGKTDLESELKIFKCTHVEVAMAVTEGWGLPHDLVEGLNYIEEPGETILKPVNSAVVAVSHLMARHAVMGISAANQRNLFDAYPKWAVDLLGLDDLKLQILVLEGEQAIATAQEAA